MSTNFYWSLGGVALHVGKRSVSTDGLLFHWAQPQEEVTRACNSLFRAVTCIMDEYGQLYTGEGFAAEIAECKRFDHSLIGQSFS